MVPSAKTIWNLRYASIARKQVSRPYDDWLTRFREIIIKTAGTKPILDLGCGQGLDSRYLLTLGLPVIAVDISDEAVQLTKEAAPDADICMMDMLSGLKFDDGSFGLILANLSLHYFSWNDTTRILSDIRRCLTENCCLLFRVNSSLDYNYGARGYREVENGYFDVDGVLKRFFNIDNLLALFKNGWSIESLEEKVSRCYGEPKVLWEGLVQRI